MADRIKGITVEIGGDPNGLVKALSKVNKEIKSTESQLKDVERLLKLDPGNTQLLEQKQRLLAEAVGGTKDKLEALKTAEKQAQEQFKKGEISQQQYEGLQREIIDTTQQLEKLEDQASRSNVALSKISTGAGKVSSVAGNVSRATAPLTAGIVGAAGAAVMAMDRVDEGLDTVMTKTGATGEAAKELQEVYNRVATTIPADFGDIGAAVGEVNTRLEFTGDKLEEASEQFLKFAKVNGTDVNTSVQLVTRAMGDAGISADEYGAVLDALTVAGQKSGISIDALATNLAKYGAPMRALGIDTQQAIAMFAGWEKAGVNTETAFSGMKKAISNWGAAGKDAAVEFQKTLDAIKAAPDIATATSMAIEAFGAKAGPDLADAIQGGRFEVEEYITALEEAGGAVDNTYAMIVDEVDDSALAMQTLQVAAHDVGETVAKTMGPLLLDAAKAVQRLFEWFGKLDGGTQKAILALLAMVAAISPVAGAVSGISGLISTMTGSVIPALSKGFATLSGKVMPALSSAFSFLAANPIILVIAAIVAVIAIVKHLWDTSEEFRTAVTEIWASIQEVFQAFDAWLTGVFSTDWTEQFGVFGGVLNGFFHTASDVWENVKLIFQGILDFVTGVFTGEWDKAWNGVKEVFGGVFGALEAIAKAPLNAVIGLLNGAIGGVNKLINGFNGIGFDMPKWLGGGSWHPNIPNIPGIPYLARGGTLLSGSAVVGEAGPELLSLVGGKALVQPLRAGERASGAASEVRHTFAPLRVEGVNDKGQFIAAADYAVEELLTDILRRQARI